MKVMGAKRNEMTPPVTHNTRGRRRGLKYTLLSLTCIAVSGLLTYGSIQLLSPVHLPPEMRGKWIVVEGKGLNGATLEFFADGRMIGVVPAAAGGVTIEGRAKVEGNRFRVVAVTGAPGWATKPQDILELNHHWFVMQDADGEVLIMQRPTTPSNGGGR
jgi:hypothetical protein